LLDGQRNVAARVEHRANSKRQISRLIAGFANITAGLDASSIEHLLNPHCKSDVIDRRIVWKFWGRVEEHELFPLHT
jgi:hypothetical protein